MQPRDRATSVLVEGFDPDAVALAAYMAGEGHEVRLAGPGPVPHNARALSSLGVRVEGDTDLDAHPGPAEVAYLDVWTPEVAPRAQRLRAQGTRISCLGDLVLERWPGPSIGITGTAGKTTTTSLVAGIARAAGADVVVSRGARARNLWPTADLLDRLHPDDSPAPESRLLLVELTSSHLAFMRTSPTIAAVISFWPDHLELHGDVSHYRAAKETIVRHQRRDDLVVVNADDASAAFVGASQAERVEFSVLHPVARGAYLDPSRGLTLVGRDGTEVLLGPAGDSPDSTHPGNIAAAAAIAAAAGAPPAAISLGLHEADPLPWRAERHGTLAGVPVVDDGMAATPSKAAATLAGMPADSVVLIAGGLLDAGGGPVHAAPEEEQLLERACDEVARACRVVILFGEAGERLSRLLRARAVDTIEAPNLADAVTVAAFHAEGAAAIVFSPLFPLTLDDRARFATLVKHSL